MLKCSDLSEVVVHGIRSGSVSNVISAMQARLFLRKGCEAFLALVLDSKRGQINLEDIPVIKEFSDVFHEELPSLPPKTLNPFYLCLSWGKPQMWIKRVLLWL